MIDEDKLPSPVCVEYAADANQFFPHVYGPLPLEAVCNTLDLRRGRSEGGGEQWQWPYADDWQHPVPARVPIAHEPNFRTELLGRYDDGLFLAGFAGATYLHLFDAQGVHRRSWIGLAEQALGAATSPRTLVEHLRALVENLPGSEFGDIAIAPFAVADAAGKRWGLLDETAPYGFPHAELHPDRLGFYPPWSGAYDT